MFSEEEYKQLVEKYGNYSSWALWSYKDESECSVIDDNINLLHSKYVLVGLNISTSLNNIPWSNFHGGKHDRKLKFACNDTKLKGSYITDLFKDIPEPNSALVKKHISEELIKSNVQFFCNEMNDIKVTNETTFIILGDLAHQYYEKYFKSNFENNVINYYHYSNYSLTDKQWVEGLWEKLNISANFDAVKARYSQSLV